MQARVQNCVSTTGGPDWASILVASAAFVVSIASLWFTSLRRPRVEVDPVEAPGTPAIYAGLWETGMADKPTVEVRLSIANTGATGTVVSRLASIRQ